MADEKISLLPAAGALDGTEPVPVVKDGVTSQTTTQAIADLAAGQLTADQLAAINGANSPDGANPFATMADITAGGNANITSINVSAIQALQTGSTLSTTTFYNVTNAAGSTRVLQVYAIANNTNVVWAVDVTTGEVGTYDIAGDVFVLTVPKFVSFKKVLTPTNVNAGGTFAVSECPAVTGAAWEVISASANLVGAVGYANVPAITLRINGTSKPQFTDNYGIFASASGFGKLMDASIVSSGGIADTNMKSNAGLLVELDDTNSTGDGTLTIYGIARLITL
jgi:hypothetical protein